MTVIAGQQVELRAEEVEAVADRVDPEPIDVWYCVVGARRFPPKQLVEAVTGIDRASFNSHQARAALLRLGFVVERRPTYDNLDHRSGNVRDEARGTLDRVAGRWVAQRGREILFVADSPQRVASWLSRHRLQARVWRVPATPAEVGSALSAAP